MMNDASAAAMSQETQAEARTNIDAHFGRYNWQTSMSPGITPFRRSGRIPVGLCAKRVSTVPRELFFKKGGHLFGHAGIFTKRLFGVSSHAKKFSESWICQKACLW